MLVLSCVTRYPPREKEKMEKVKRKKEPATPAKRLRNRFLQWNSQENRS